MTVDELKELLGSRKCSGPSDDEDDLREKVKQMRVEIAHLKSENSRLKEKYDSLRAFTDKAFVIRF